MKVRGGLFGALLAAALAVASSAAAQGDSIPTDRAELFAYLVRNPADVRATLRYADLSKEAGDIEAAIGALERVLFYKPDEPNTRLYLGLLYARLGSYDMARGYFESVMEHPGTPQPIKDASYRDATVIPGVRYVYVVVAVDNARPRNQSPPSAREEVTAR